MKNNMKTYVFLILIFLNVFSHLQAQTKIAGNEQYNAFEECVYMDNVFQEIIPEVFISAYYSKLKVSDFKNSQIIDTVRQKREIHIRTREAKGGYLFVNTKIMDKLAVSNSDISKLKISYVYDNKVAMTKKDVMQILKLKEKQIQISDILLDEQSGIITVLIFTKY